MASREEEIKRLKLKLKLYGSYKREYEQKEHRYFEVLDELRLNDIPANAAKNLGIHSSDPYHPVDAKLIHEKHSLPSELEKLDEEINYLGLDDLFNSMNEDERLMFDEYYINNKTYQEIADTLFCVKSTVYKTMKKKLNGNVFPPNL